MRLSVALRLLAASGLAGVVPLVGAAPAHASLDGPCFAVGTVDGETYDPKTTDEVEGLPRKGEVVWQASVESPNEPPRPVSGDIEIELPGGIGAVSLGSWGDESDDFENNDVYEYDLPAVVEGIQIPVTGSHSENGVECSGAITVTVGESGFRNPATVPALVLTAISGALLIVAIKAAA